MKLLQGFEDHLNHFALALNRQKAKVSPQIAPSILLCQPENMFNVSSKRRKLKLAKAGRDRKRIWRSNTYS